MDLKKITAKFKSMAQKLEEQVNEEVVELKEATLTDGTIIKYDSLEVGSMVMVITEEGEVPAPDAAHQLEDGTIVTTEGGAITEIVEAEEAPEVSEEDEMFNAEQEFAALKKENENLKAELAKVQAQFAEIPNTLKAMSDTLEQVEKVVEMAAQEPAAQPAEKQKNISITAFKSAFK
jgi:prophage DNA circulation protein